MQFNNQINYKRILSLLAFSIVTITIILYMALTEGKPEEYNFIGDWTCVTKDKKLNMSLTITESVFSVNNKKTTSYFPKSRNQVENEYNLFNGKEKIAKIKEFNDNKISFKQNGKNENIYYCKRIGIQKQ